MREMNFLLQSQLSNNLYTVDSTATNLRRKQQQQNIKESSYQDDKETNPYLYILNKLSTNLGTSIQPKDLAYLKELGVQPVNRMFILRRWDSGPIEGPKVDIWADPNYKDKKPVSVVVGWIPDDELFNISVNEGWTTSKELIHQVIGKILKEFGIKGEKIASVPGWSQGLMLRLIKSISGEELSSNQIMQYFGNPNVLMEGATRSASGGETDYNLRSAFNFTLKTTYEAKYIYDIDPVDAMKSIVDNLLSMGSSPEVHFDLGEKVNNIASGLATSDAEGGWIVIKDIIKDFMGGITQMIKDATGAGEESLDIEKKKETDSGELDADEQAKIDAIDKKDDDNTLTDDEKENIKNRERILASQTPGATKIDTNKSATNKLQVAGKAAYLAADEKSKLINKVLESNFMNDIFAVTIAKYRYNFRGTWGLHTGLNTTPWHLTIGNPLSPVLSLNNIIVSDLSIKAKNNFTYNDIPEEIEATISIKQSRNMGIQKISEMFFRKHIRTYASGEILDRTLANGNPVYVGNFYENLSNDEKYNTMDLGIDGMANTKDNTTTKDKKKSATN
jgi:hypothetical protein